MENLYRRFRAEINMGLIFIALAAGEFYFLSHNGINNVKENVGLYGAAHLEPCWKTNQNKIEVTQTPYIVPTQSQQQIDIYKQNVESIQATQTSNQIKPISTPQVVEMGTSLPDLDPMIDIFDNLPPEYIDAVTNIVFYHKNGDWYLTATGLTLGKGTTSYFMMDNHSYQFNEVLDAQKVDGLLFRTTSARDKSEPENYGISNSEQIAYIGKNCQKIVRKDGTVAAVLIEGQETTGQNQKQPNRAFPISKIGGPCTKKDDTLQVIGFPLINDSTATYISKFSLPMYLHMFSINQTGQDNMGLYVKGATYSGMSGGPVIDKSTGQVCAGISAMSNYANESVLIQYPETSVLTPLLQAFMKEK